MSEFSEIGEGSSSLLPTDDRHVALRAALTIADFSAMHGKVMTFDELIDGTAEIYNFLKINQEDNE